MPTTVNVHQAKTHLSRLLERVMKAYYHDVKSFPKERVNTSRKRQALGVSRPV